MQPVYNDDVIFGRRRTLRTELHYFHFLPFKKSLITRKLLTLGDSRVLNTLLGNHVIGHSIENIFRSVKPFITEVRFPHY